MESKTIMSTHGLKDAIPDRHPLKMRFDAFLEWVKKNGAKFDKVGAVFHSPNERRMYATADIELGEEVVFIPKKIFITKDNFARNTLCSNVA